ncbi:MAG: acetyltransferase [Frondihabitans sp.]|nr:acetyltransferase [Frondihabitans sp.]
MQIEQEPCSVRRADLTGTDNEAVGRLVGAYLRQTEREKAFHLGLPEPGADLPERYRAEVDNPARAYEHAEVFVAELDESPVGVVVVLEGSTVREVKRVWVDPRARGRRIGSALLDSALSEEDLPLRLTVWDWRDDAIRLYRKRGFITVASWENRPRLLCMERPAHPGATVQSA